MSRAFLKEDDGESEELPPRPVSPLPNYVTAAGRAALAEKVRELGARRRALARSRHESASARKLKEVERDLRYYEQRLESAILVDHSEVPPEGAAFGASLELEEPGGARRAYRIVGEDEADPESGKLCWASPLANLLLGKKPGETAVWKRPDGEVRLKILSVRF